MVNVLEMVSRVSRAATFAAFNVFFEAIDGVQQVGAEVRRCCELYEAEKAVKIGATKKEKK